MKRHRLLSLCFFGLFLIALGFRLPSLDNRPLHGDEAVHAFKFRDILEKGEYRYDSNEYHGPTLYYLNVPFTAFSRHRSFEQITEADYRLPIAVTGAGIVLLLYLMADGLGYKATLVSGLLLVCSPAFVFYSRYYIQETVLVFFNLAMLGAGWRFVRDQKTVWLPVAGMCAGLMIATKETVVLAFLASGIAVMLTSKSAGSGQFSLIDYLRQNRRLVGFSVLVCLFTAALLLTGFLKHPVAVIDYLRSYTPWLNRAHGTSIHRYPWYHYLHLVGWWREGEGPVWSEGLILVLAVAGTFFAWTKSNGKPGEGRSQFARFLTVYAWVLTLIYSLIPYKTPWCVLNILLGMILLAGVGVVGLVQCVQNRPIQAVISGLILAGIIHLGWQAYRASFVMFMDSRNPYVYSQPDRELRRLVDRIALLSEASPQKRQVTIQVVSIDNYYWPLPWYLRSFSNVGYWTTVPEQLTAPIILSSPEFDEVMTKRLDATHLMTGIYGLRPNAFFQIWVRMDVWTEYIRQKKLRQGEKGETEGEE